MYVYMYGCENSCGRTCVFCLFVLFWSLVWSDDGGWGMEGRSDYALVWLALDSGCDDVCICLMFSKFDHV